MSAAVKRLVTPFAAALALAAAIFIAVYYRGGVNRAVGDAVSRGVNGLRTVEAIISERSPGGRVEGALVSLKQKRSALHERALAKVRPPATLGPLASVIGSPPIPPISPPTFTTAPLYNVVGGVASPAAVIPGPQVAFPIILPPGGGGLIVPPIVTPSVNPVTPVVPLTPIAPVPEPTSWAMMLIGFAMIGWVLRRDSGAAATAAGP